MSYKYNPTSTELRQAFEVAYGDVGIYSLYGALFANVSDETIERLYREALDKVRADVDKLVVCTYCETIYAEGTAVCNECNEYDGLILMGEKK